MCADGQSQEAQPLAAGSGCLRGCQSAERRALLLPRFAFNGGFVAMGIIADLRWLFDAGSVVCPR